MGLRFVLDLGSPTCVNAGLLFTLLHIENLTSLLSSFREILENLYCLSKRGVAMHSKWAAAVIEQVRTSGPATVYRRRSELEHAGPHALHATSSEQNRRNVMPNPPQRGRLMSSIQEMELRHHERRMVKHLTGTDSRKVGGMRSVRDVLLKSPTDKLKDHDMLREIVRARSSSPDERQMGADVPLRRVVKHGVDSTLLAHLEVRLAEAKKTRESSARAKGSYVMPTTNHKMGKFNPAGDAGVSDMLKMNFLSSPSTCAELVNHIRQAGDLDTFSSLYLEKQREGTFHLLQKGLVFAAETIQNSSVVALSSTQLSELEEKNVELASKLPV
ncbi:unnamed protein product [Prunus armeniaca]